MAIAASSASSATSSLMAQTLSLRRAIKAGLCPLVSIICTYCMLFKYKDNVYTKHRHIFWLPWYTSSIFAGCTRYPFSPFPRGGAQKSLSFFWLLAHVSMDRYANATNLILKMPPALLHTLSWYVHFYPCVFCNYGRITKGLLSLHTPTHTHKLKINLNCMS